MTCLSSPGASHYSGCACHEARWAEKLVASEERNRRLEEALREWVPALREACVRVVVPKNTNAWMWLALLGEARDAADALDAALAPPPEAAKKGGE